jgi:hypothetical protein
MAKYPVSDLDAGCMCTFKGEKTHGSRLFANYYEKNPKLKN